MGDAAVTERLDATLDDYEVEGRKLERASWSNQEVIFGTPISSASLEVQPVATDRLVNGDAAHHHSVRFVTHVDLHHSPPDVDVVVQPAAAAAVAAVPDEPEPDYDSKDDDSPADGLPEPPLTGSVSGGGLARAAARSPGVRRAPAGRPSGSRRPIDAAAGDS